MGSKSRNKGHAFERWCAKRLRRIFPRARRQLEFQKDVAAEGVDIAHTGRYRIQCKKFKRYVNPSMIRQIKICPIEGGCPVLVTAGDRSEALAVLPFEEFLALVRIAEWGQ